MKSFAIGRSREKPFASQIWARTYGATVPAKKPLSGEMWFQVTDQPIFAVAGFWQYAKEGAGFTIVTFEPNELVAPIHPEAMITVLHPDDPDRWPTGSYHDVAALQWPYPAAQTSEREPVFPTRVP